MDNYSFAKSAAISIPPSVMGTIMQAASKTKAGIGKGISAIKGLGPAYFNFTGAPVSEIGGALRYGYTPKQTLINAGSLGGTILLGNELNRGAALRDANAQSLADTTNGIANTAKTNIATPDINTSLWGQLPTAAKVGLGVGVPSIALMIALEALDKPKAKGINNDDEN